MSELRYEAPRTLAAAVALLAGANGKARVLAGGTDVLIQMRSGRIEPELLVDVKGIPEMTSVAAEDGGYRLGAAAAAMDLVENAALAKAWPGVIEGIRYIGSLQVKARASVGGNLCNASPAADSIPALIAAGASARIIGPKGTREVRWSRFPRARARPRSARASSSFRSSAQAPAAFRRRVSALHPSHGNGHRGGRRRSEPRAG